MAKKPVGYTEGALLLRYGNYNKRRGESVLNVPVLDNLFFRVNGLHVDLVHHNLLGVGASSLGSI